MKNYEISGTTLSVSLFIDVTNSKELLELMQSGTLEPEVALLNASLIPDIFPVLAAAHKTLVAKSRDSLTTCTLHSELVYNYSGSKHISESLKRCGISDSVTYVLAARFGASEEEMNAVKTLIKGKEIDIEELDGRANKPQIQKLAPKRRNLTMSKTSFLDIQYNISKRKFLRKPSRMFSSSDRQPSGLPIFQPNMNETRHVFDKFDLDKDGKISRREYKAILKALRQGGTESDVQKIFEAADLDGDGFIDFNEFMEVQKCGVKVVDVQSAFRTFDLDGDGKISVEEVYQLMKRLGERCSLQDCRKMVRAVDSNEDGVIDMDEFMSMMTQNMKI